MTAKWEIYLSDPKGNRIAMLDRTLGFSVSRVRNGIGAAVIALPAETFDNLFALDYLLEFWRTPDGGKPDLFNVYFIRQWRFDDDSMGAETTTLWAYDANYLIAGRIVAYNAASAQALQTDYADDMMKEVIIDALIGDAGTGRNLAAVGGGITSAAQLGAGASITKGMSWMNVLDVLVDIAEASRGNGTNVFFDMVPGVTSAGLITWQFTTYTTRRGANHGTTSSQPVYFGRQWGNLEGGYYEIDHTAEINYVYGRGQGTEGNRYSADVYDAARYGASIWNRREGYCNASIGGEGEDDEATSAQAYAMLEENRPAWRAGGRLLDTTQARYGVDWSFGDTVVMEQRKRQFDVDVTAVNFSVDGDGQEISDIRVEVDGA